MEIKKKIPGILASTAFGLECNGEWRAIKLELQSETDMVKPRRVDERSLQDAFIPSILGLVL